MSLISFFANHGVQVVAAPERQLTIKGLSRLSDGTRQEVLTFARDNKRAIINSLELGSAPLPDLSTIEPGHHQEYTTLWYRAWTFADYVEGDAPYPDRLKKMPVLTKLVERMRELENMPG